MQQRVTIIGEMADGSTIVEHVALPLWRDSECERLTWHETPAPSEELRQAGCWPVTPVMGEGGVMALDFHPPQTPIPLAICEAVAAQVRETVMQSSFHEQAWQAIGALMDTLTVSARDEETILAAIGRVMQVEEQAIRVSALAGLLHGWCEREGVTGVDAIVRRLLDWPDAPTDGDTDTRE